MAETIELDELPEVFAGIQEQYEKIDWRGVLLDWHTELEFIHGRYFVSGGGPAGSWAPNAPSTVARKGHGRVLYGLTEQLYASVTQDSAQGAVREVMVSHVLKLLTFGTRVPYGIYNQEGTQRAPARPFVGVSEEVVEQFTDDAANHIAKNLKEE